MSGTTTSPNTTYYGSTTSNAYPGVSGQAAQWSYENGISAITGSQFQPYTGEMTAGINPLQNTAAYNQIQLGNGYQPQQVNAGNITGYTTGSGPGGLSLQGQNLSGYMNPYTQSVINTTNQSLSDQLAQQQATNDGRAAMSGAFGGDRAGIVNAQTAYNTDQLMAQTDAGLNQSNFSNAQGLATGDLNRQLQAGTTQAGLGLQAGQGNQFADIQGANLRQGANNSAFQMGTAFQNTNQTADTNAYGQYLRAFQYPAQQALLQGQLTSEYAPSLAANSTQTSTGINTPPSPSTLGQIAGGLTSAAGLSGLLFGGGGSSGSGGGLLGSLGSGASSIYNSLFSSKPDALVGSDLLGVGGAAKDAYSGIDAASGLSDGSWIDTTGLFAAGGRVGGGLAAYADGGAVDDDSATYLAADDDLLGSDGQPILPPDYVPPPEQRKGLMAAAADAGTGPGMQSNVSMGGIAQLANLPPIAPVPDAAASPAPDGPAVPIGAAAEGDQELPTPPSYVPPPDGVAGADRVTQSANPSQPLPGGQQAPGPSSPPQGLAVGQPAPGTAGAPAGIAGAAQQPGTTQQILNRMAQRDRNPDWLDNLNRGSNNWAMPVLAAGAAMLASRSPFAGNAIGEGLGAGLQTAQGMYGARQAADARLLQLAQANDYHQGLVQNGQGRNAIAADRAATYADSSASRSALQAAQADLARYRAANPHATAGDVQMQVMKSLTAQGMDPGQAWAAMKNFDGTNAFRAGQLDLGQQRVNLRRDQQSDLEGYRKTVTQANATGAEDRAARGIISSAAALGKSVTYDDALKQVRAARQPSPAASPVPQASPAIAEGATATNPQSGAKMVYQGGQWQTL